MENELKKPQLQVEYVPISDIRPYENNAKLHPDEQVDEIVESIRRVGFRDPIGVWNGEIVEGHGRYMAAMKLGMDTVPIIRLDDMTDEERRAYILIHNKTTMDSGFDTDILRKELEALKDFDMSDFNFELPDEEIAEAKDDDFDTTPPEDPVSKPGQIWQLGRHRVMCGDSTDDKAVTKLLGGVKADLLMTDPPYNVTYEGKTQDHLTIQNDTMEDKEFRAFLDEAFMSAKVNMKGGAAFYICHADSEGYNFRGACHDIGWQVRQCLIWNKNVFVMGRQDYQWKHEPILYGWNEGDAHAWYSDRKQCTVLNFDRPQKSLEHPTMKPIPLFDYLIRNSSKPGDIVLDTFGGSGTTIMACEQNGRNGYCMELDPKYVDVIINRWEAFTGEKAQLISEGE